ncbi:MAG: hypothetical protein AAF290_10670 [Pseudomonadota bacterium]
MSKLEEMVAFVKEQIQFHSERASHFEKNKFRREKHLETANKFNELKTFIESPVPIKYTHPEQLSLALSPSDIVDLPDELKSELSIGKTDEEEFTIVRILEHAGGIMSLDQVLIGFYRETGVVMKRATMNNRLNRMMSKNMIFGVPGKKGVYSLAQIIEAC